ncbi:MAG: hypothetical protein ACJATV_001581 [Granulosicoccus sp.]|jgi:hypothetical protein
MIIIIAKTQTASRFRYIAKNKRNTFILKNHDFAKLFMLFTLAVLTYRTVFFTKTW